MSFNELERIAIPENIDYMSIHGLKIEARSSWSSLKLRQASRISGVSPPILLCFLENQVIEVVAKTSRHICLCIVCTPKGAFLLFQFRLKRIAEMGYNIAMLAT